MELSFLDKKDAQFSVCCFFPGDQLGKVEQLFEPFAEQAHVHIMLQPCPFEGVEFLYRAQVDLPGQKLSIDKDIFWHALRLGQAQDAAELKHFADLHHQLFISLLDQNPHQLEQTQAELLMYLDA